MLNRRDVNDLCTIKSRVTSHICGRPDLSKSDGFEYKHSSGERDLGDYDSIIGP